MKAPSPTREMAPEFLGAGRSSASREAINVSVVTRVVRPLIGIAVSALFVGVTLARVDFRRLGTAWEGIAVELIILAALISFAEVTVRAIRWGALLAPFADAKLTTTLAFLSVGHLANAILPARLGDVARAFLAGGRLGVSRVTVFGTIAVERVADAGLLLLAAAAAVAIGYTSLAPALGILALAGVACVLVVLVAARVLGGDAVVDTRVGLLIRDHAKRFVAGATALRRLETLRWVVILTITSYGLAVLIMQVLGSAAGLSLSPWQSAVVIAAVTLSTAIPAGPASLGTYEFVGMTVLVSMGFAPERSLLAIVLVHAVATIVPAALGLVAMWRLQLRSLTPETTSFEAAEEAPRQHGTPASATPLSVVIPAHNSGALIEQTVSRLAKRLEGRQAEIIVVENGSTDDTWLRCVDVASAWHARDATYLPLQSAKGMGNALRTGIVASSGATILLTADDLPFGFDDLDAFDRLAAKLDTDVPALIIGSKAHPNSSVNRGLRRSLLTRGFAVLRRAILGMRTGDPQGTLIIDGALARYLAGLSPETGFLFTTELVYLAERLGICPLEVPVRLSRDHGLHASRINVGDMMSMAVGLIVLRTRHWGDGRGSRRSLEWPSTH